jgi:hypothetical protein
VNYLQRTDGLLCYSAPGHDAKMASADQMPCGVCAIIPAFPHGATARTRWTFVGRDGILPPEILKKQRAQSAAGAYSAMQNRRELQGSAFSGWKMLVETKGQ